jgi:hypothetical protein
MPVAQTSPPDVGQLVSVRARRWVVGEVDKSTLPPKALEPVASLPSTSFRSSPSRTTLWAKSFR